MMAPDPIPGPTAIPAALWAELEAVFAQVAAEIQARGPACWASGRCCNFTAAGHRLYVTGLETLYTLAHLVPADRPTPAAMEDASARGGCPFQDGHLCGIHEIKPLGCRVYFCDRSAQEWQQDLTERMLARLRALHDQFEIDYRYGEWLGMLESALAGPIPDHDRRVTCSRRNSAQSRPVDLTLGGSGGERPNTPDSPPFSTAQ